MTFANDAVAAATDSADTFSTFAKTTVAELRASTPSPASNALTMADMQSLIEAQTRLTTAMMQFAFLPLRAWMTYSSSGGTGREQAR